MPKLTAGADGDARDDKVSQSLIEILEARTTKAELKQQQQRHKGKILKKYKKSVESLN